MSIICILTQSHLCRNPRVLKEAKALAQTGYQVYVLTTFISHELYKEDIQLFAKGEFEYLGIIDLRIQYSSPLYRFRTKLARRMATEVLKLSGIEVPGVLGYGWKYFYAAAKKIHADLYIAHQEMPTYVGCQLLEEGYKTAFDLEDWYSEDLLPSARKNRPIHLLKKIEQNALLSGVYTCTTSLALAKAMAESYRAPQPAVIYNAFSSEERNCLDGLVKDRVDKQRPSLFWFSQTIGPGRGLELLCEALQCVTTPVGVYLRGQYEDSYIQNFKALIPKRHELYLLNLTSPQELLSRISEHTLGFALEESTPRSRDLTVTNKILQYILAGIPVIASDTQGQREVAEMAPGAVALFPCADATALASCINKWLDNPILLNNARKDSLKAAEETFCWEKQVPKLIHLVEKALLKDIIN